MQYQIEEMTVKDILQVKFLEREGNLSNWTNSDYENEIKSEDSAVFVSRKNNSEILGFIVARLIMKDTIANSFLMEIMNFYVTPSSRSKNIGSQLLNRVEKSIKHFKFGKIFLEVRRTNTIAINFYKKHNFVITGERKNYYHSPLEDALLMTKSVVSE